MRWAIGAGILVAAMAAGGCTSGGQPPATAPPTAGPADGNGGAPPARGCAVTRPSPHRPLPPSPAVRFVNGEYIPGNSNAFGNADLWAGLPVDGDLVARRTPAGFAATLGWWQVHPGTLRVGATALRGTSRGFTARVTMTGYSGRTGFRASRLVFPARGCWRVTGRMRGRAPLVFTVNVSDASLTPAVPSPADPNDEWHVTVAPDGMAAPR